MKDKKSMVAVTVGTVVAVSVLMVGVYHVADTLVSRVDKYDNVVSSESVIEKGKEISYNEDGTADVLFDSEGVLDRQMMFLGENYKNYIDVLTGISTEYNDMLNSIEIGERTYENSLELVGQVDDFVWNDIQGYDSVIIRDALTVIGLLDDNIIVYAYDMDGTGTETIFVVDYEGVKLNTSSTDYIDFGDMEMICLDAKYCIRSFIGETEVIYVKNI